MSAMRKKTSTHDPVVTLHDAALSAWELLDIYRALLPGAELVLAELDTALAAFSCKDVPACCLATADDDDADDDDDDSPVDIGRAASGDLFPLELPTDE